jgi:murein DD-endopeptidase MepM/ murein hydrolase activator NlpD
MFLKDLALLGLGGFALYDRIKQGKPHAVEASPALRDVPAIAALENIPFDFVSPLLSFTLPIMGFSLKTLPASRLPNAPRAYRQGKHEGLDLYVPFGTKVFAVADGIVTRADEHFRELDPGLHRLYLAESGDLRMTPPDILDYLHGRRVEIDHGLRESVRWRSVYSHLSQVLVTPGMRITQGEPVGNVGNSGTTAGVRRSRDDAHLHLEIRMQRAGSEETYVGDGLTEREVRRLLEELFHA